MAYQASQTLYEGGLGIELQTGLSTTVGSVCLSHVRVCVSGGPRVTIAGARGPTGTMGAMAGVAAGVGATPGVGITGRTLAGTPGALPVPGLAVAGAVAVVFLPPLRTAKYTPTANAANASTSPIDKNTVSFFEKAIG